MLAIENNRENRPKINKIYDVLTEFHEQRKQLTLCKVSTHLGIKGNEEAEKTGNRYDRADHNKTKLY